MGLKKLELTSFFKYSIIGLFIVALAPASWGQGCSDAGFCSLGAMDGGDHQTRTEFSLRLTQTAESGQDEVFMFGTKLRSSLYFGDYTAIELELPFWNRTGPLGNLSAIGDPSIVWVQEYPTDYDIKLKSTVGVKIPSNRADLKDGLGRDLPMVYQSSLGTYDGLVGVSFTVKSFVVSLGTQIVLNSVNENKYTPTLFDSTLPKPSNTYYNPLRKSDLLLRLQRGFGLGKKSELTGGLVLIYHLAKDQYTDIGENQITDINGSEGLTLNLSVGYSQTFANDQRLDIGLGFPIVTRETQPFGLQRKWVFSVAYSIDR